jgi:hypothetical protein
LKQHGVDADPNTTLETLAKENGLSPAELFTLVSDNI